MRVIDRRACGGRRRRSGVAAVEMAVVLPTLLLVTLGCVDFARLAYAYITITGDPLSASWTGWGRGVPKTGERTMLLRPRKAARRGAALVEAGIVLPVFITLIVGAIDLGLAVSRSQMVAQGAHEVSRLAMVHGSLAP